MAGGLRANARAHVHNMTANFGRTCMPWGRKQSVWAGCSGGFFCVPGLFGLSADPSSHWMLVAFVAQAVLSVMSDYVATGRDSVWHGLDRWTATCMTMFMVYFAHSAVSPWHCLLAVPPLMCLHGSKAAIARADWSAYVVWHTLWHVAAVSTSTYIMYLANGDAGLVIMREAATAMYVYVRAAGQGAGADL